MNTKRAAPTVEQVLVMLEVAPARIAEAVAGASRDQLHTSPGPGEWSANEVLAHLRACADVWGGYIARVLAENNPTIRAMSPRRWIDSTDYVRLDFRKSLRAFTAQRTDLLTVLQSLTPKSWKRRATVTGAGRPLVKTLYDYAEWIASHERPHLKQIRRAVEATAR